MRSYRSLRNDIVSALILCVIAVAIALAWGSPFIEATPAQAQDNSRLQQLLEKIPLRAKPHPGTLSRSAVR